MTPPDLDGLIHLAIRAHQAGDLARAEAVYGQALAIRPQLPEIVVNLGLAQLGQGKHHAAIATLERATKLDARLAKAHYHLGSALAAVGRFEPAVDALRQATRLTPNHAEAHNNLGNALLSVGRLEEAILAYARAIALKPGFALAHNNLGHALLQAGRADEAAGELQRAIRAAPAYAEAHNNLGRALHDLRRHAEAAAAFQAAIRLDPNHPEAHANLSASLYDAGDPAAAEQVARRAVALDPAAPAAHNALGNAVRHQGRAAEAEAHYREALRIAPGYVEGYKHLAMCLQELGRLKEAFALFDRHAELTREAKRPRGPIDPEPKEFHDSERAAWLAANPAGGPVGERVDGPAVNPANAVARISAAWRTSDPQIAVVDALLTPPALDSLRQFCLRSDSWRESFERGYLGAVPESGFTPPIVAQIAEELRTIYPAIIGDHPLMYFWGFKYDSSRHGIKIHADFAAVNINFWITPDEANLDPSSGGLVVWDVPAPLDWTFERYNAADEDIRALIRDRQGQRTVVPYRCNRAVFFDSDLFHETDAIHFKGGYDERRINVTLLFGRREAAAQPSVA